MAVGKRLASGSAAFDYLIIILVLAASDKIIELILSDVYTT